MRIDNPTFQPGGLNIVPTSSYFEGGQATYIGAGKTVTAQSIGLTEVIVTNWDAAYTSINAGEWNATTGVFTATKAGIYSVNANIQLTIGNYSGNTGTTAKIYKNSTSLVTGIGIVGVALTSTFPPPAFVNGVVSLAAGDTITIRTNCNSGASYNTHTLGCFLTIEEIPSRIQR